jgi:hypothetical protein
MEIPRDQLKAWANGSPSRRAATHLVLNHKAGILAGQHRPWIIRLDVAHYGIDPTILRSEVKPAGPDTVAVAQLAANLLDGGDVDLRTLADVEPPDMAIIVAAFGMLTTPNMPAVPPELVGVDALEAACQIATQVHATTVRTKDRANAAYLVASVLDRAPNCAHVTLVTNPHGLVFPEEMLGTNRATHLGMAHRLYTRPVYFHSPDLGAVLGRPKNAGEPATFTDPVCYDPYFCRDVLNIGPAAKALQDELAAAGINP